MIKDTEIWNSNSPDYGLIDDIDPTDYNESQLNIVSLGRGHDFAMGNVDDLDPKKYTAAKMSIVSWGRGINSNYGNVDDLDPEMHTYTQMVTISKSRAYADYRLGVYLYKNRNGDSKEEDETNGVN